ncbi:uncharacterized protein LOC112184417 [Rosa chinensis]|uniref:uncharacterized protein LOC112184417 n=1 Tax=Rosa chinensis TaxID=74649 RepID=UPI000D091F04|nr:uncharacterized protein LOC112184417 [Rosa chinensis]
MMEDYFVEHPFFSEEEFRTRYRMNHNVFNRISSDVCLYDWYFVQKSDGWAREYHGRKRVPTIILEAVLSYDTWIWHAFFGIPGSCNDLNVLAKSPLFEKLTAGRAPQIQFQVNYRIHNLGYYLADGIYPQWLRFSIVQGAARGWDREDLRYIMLTCIILHNMIIEDERPDDSNEDLESDEEEDNNMRPRLAQVWVGPTGDDFDPVGRDGYYFNGFIDRYGAIRSANSHSNLQEDLIEHFWNIKGNMEIICALGKVVADSIHGGKKVVGIHQGKVIVGMHQGMPLFTYPFAIGYILIDFPLGDFE